ncbi:MAG TPA: LysR substrate-binding domain-containing protein [Acetobacteraceae bacterium]|nr:LysR substrate-binding domain-containing protein [Acetobacteraceae bacterium]
MQTAHRSPFRSLAGLSLRDLEYAQAVGQLRHFGRAAERCGVSQPALSEQVRKLEAYLGVALFERTKRHVSITEAGTALLEQIDQLISQARNLLAMSQIKSQSAGSLTGLLSIGAIETLGPYYLPGMLRLLRGGRPELSLRLTERRTARLFESLADGSLDLLLLALPVDKPGLAVRPLFFEPFMLATPPGHALTGLRPISLDALPLDDLLLLEEGHCLRDHALAACHASNERQRPAMRHATSLETLWHMIAAGEGYSLLPALAVAARPEFSDLVTCEALDDQRAGRDIALVWRQADPRSAAFNDLAGFLATHAPAGVVPAI